MGRILLVLTGVGLLLAGCGDGTTPQPAAAASPPSAGASGTTPTRHADASPVPSVAPAPGEHRLALSHGGTTRSALLHAPPTYRPGEPLPLVVALHFYPGDGAAVRTTTGLDAKADREGFLVAYPDGLDGGFNALICCGQADDVGFLRALVAHLVDRWGADPDRVYLTGISNGGDMSFRAAVELPGVFAAIGVVSGGYSGPLTERADYVPRQPVSVVTVIGGQDRYAETFTRGIDTWRQRLGCPPGPVRKIRNGTHTVARCTDGSEVSVYHLPAMGHSWPGARDGGLADPDAGLVATDVLWSFFATHPRRR